MQCIIPDKEDFIVSNYIMPRGLKCGKKTHVLSESEKEQINGRATEYSMEVKDEQRASYGMKGSKLVCLPLR